MTRMFPVSRLVDGRRFAVLDGVRERLDLQLVVVDRVERLCDFAAVDTYVSETDWSWTGPKQSFASSQRRSASTR